MLAYVMYFDLRSSRTLFPLSPYYEGFHETVSTVRSALRALAVGSMIFPYLLLPGRIVPVRDCVIRQLLARPAIAAQMDDKRAVRTSAGQVSEMPTIRPNDDKRV